MTCNDCIHIAVCYRRVGMTSDSYAEKCGDYEPSRKGHWRDYSEDGYVECPFCEHATNCEDDIDELHYCFYCGAELSADMRGDTE